MCKQKWRWIELWSYNCMSEGLVMNMCKACIVGRRAIKVDGVLPLGGGWERGGVGQCKVLSGSQWERSNSRWCNKIALLIIENKEDHRQRVNLASLICWQPFFHAAWTMGRFSYSRVCRSRPWRSSFLPPMLLCPLFCVTNRIIYHLLTGWDVISHNIHQHRLAWGTPTGSLKAAAHANIWDVQALSTGPNRAGMARPGSLTMWNTVSSTRLPMQVGGTLLQNSEWKELTFQVPFWNFSSWQSPNFFLHLI